MKLVKIPSSYNWTNKCGCKYNKVASIILNIYKKCSEMARESKVFLTFNSAINLGLYLC